MELDKYLCTTFPVNVCTLRLYIHYHEDICLCIDLPHKYSVDKLSLPGIGTGYSLLQASGDRLRWNRQTRVHKQSLRNLS